jgi:hypothetical protein
MLVRGKMLEGWGRLASRPRLQKNHPLPANSGQTHIRFGAGRGQGEGILLYYFLKNLGENDQLRFFNALGSIPLN